MPKTKYIAIDPHGDPHTRSSDRVYTHTVVYLRSYEAAIERANSKDWTDGDSSNFDFYSRIANGNDPHPEKYYRVEGATNWQAPNGWTAEQVAEEKARVDAHNAERRADAASKIEGHTVESYVEACRLARVASVEAKNAAGYYRTFANAGWCGRLGLAQALAAKQPGLSVTILEAGTK